MDQIELECIFHGDTNGKKLQLHSVIFKEQRETDFKPLAQVYKHD